MSRPQAGSADVPRVPRVPKWPLPPVADSPRMGRLEADVAAAPDGGAQVVDAFWAEVARRGTPLIEVDGTSVGHRVVTFLHRDAGAEVVVLRANKLTDPSAWEESTLRRVAGTDVWHRSYRLRDDYLGTYQLAAGGAATAVGSDPPVSGPALRWRGLADDARPDPQNPGSFPAKGGGAELSVVALPRAPRQPDDPPATGPGGILEERRVPAAALGEATRRVLVHRPDAPLGADTTVLVVLDGEDWAGRLRIGALLDALRTQGGRPVLALLCEQGDTARRWRELGLHEPYVEHLVGELLPWARATYGVRADRAATVVAGQSLGGLTALWSAVRAPGAVGAVIAQSASLWFPQESDDGLGGAVVDELEAAADLPATRFHVEVGLEEWMLVERHRRLREVLTAGGARCSYVERAGGHDAVLWRIGLADGLRELVG